MLVAGRTVAGVGASALFNGGMIILGLDVPLRKRVMCIALLSATCIIWPFAGIMAGAALVNRLSWRWCLWINLP